MKARFYRLPVLFAFLFPLGGCEMIEDAFAPICMEWRVAQFAYDADAKQWLEDTAIYTDGDEDERVRELDWIDSQIDMYLGWGGSYAGESYDVNSPVTGNLYSYEIVCTYYQY